MSLCEFKRVFARSWPHNRIFIAYFYRSFLYQIKQSKEGKSPPWAGGGPDAVKRSSLKNRSYERFEKEFYNGNDFLEGSWSVDQLGLPEETLPLNIFVPIHPE